MPIAAAITSASPPVRLRARPGSRPKRGDDALTASCEADAVRIVRVRDTADRDKAAAKALDRLLVAIEAPPVDAAVRAKLARSLDRHGEAHVILLVRTIIESEGNAIALVEPITGAVSSVMVFHPEWPNRGLSWIAAFDDLPLMTLRRTMVDLDIFQPGEIGHYFFMVLRNRLRKVFEPPEPPKAKPPRKVYSHKRPRAGF